MKLLTANTAIKNFDAMLEDVTRYNEPVAIVSDDSRAVVIINKDEWDSIQETLYLNSIPGMVESIKEAAAEPMELGISASEIEFDV